MGNQEQDSGLVAVGGELSVENLVTAYRHGVFPWPASSNPLEPIPWFCPPERGVLEFQDLHIPRSLTQARRRARYRYSIDTAFEDVIAACARAYRPGQPGTWITLPMLTAYGELHRAGFAHSVEVWDETELVGGIYGVAVDGAFAGESMFHTRPNASKLALLYLIEHLAARGATWIDIQMVTPHLEALGARAIPRAEFLKKLALTHRQRLQLFF